MRLLKINRYLLLLSIVTVYSCGNNSIPINNYKNGIIEGMRAECKFENNELNSKIEFLIFKNKNNCMPTTHYLALENYKFIKNALDSTLARTNFNSILIGTHFNQLIHKMSTYNEWRNKWKSDTINFVFSKSNPEDTIILKALVSNKNLLIEHEVNINLIKLSIAQSNYTAFNHWVKRLDGSYYLGFSFTKVNSHLHYSNKVVFQNEVVNIIPGLASFDKTDLSPIYIFKENTNEFIMEKGERKLFTNPINIKASSKKGVHTVKGVIMIKKRGELVPKPFDFRYIIE